MNCKLEETGQKLLITTQSWAHLILQPIHAHTIVWLWLKHLTY